MAASHSRATARNSDANRSLKRAALGYDAGKKVMGRKRHAMVDTDGAP